MGILRLMQLIQEKCPDAVKTLELKSYTGRLVACDASMTIYQFLISTQHTNKGFGVGELKDKDGNLTGHILGLFNRTVQFLENGIRPCWVFDGKPPDLKRKILEDRKKRKNIAEENKSDAIDTGNYEQAVKFAGQSVKITSTMLSDAKTLIKLLGCPVIEAPSEAEAQCSILAKAGKVFAVASEDLDCLTFGCPVQLRNFTTKDEPVKEIKLEQVLKGLDLTMTQFIDLCILCGCDYTNNIDGIGSIKAHKLITEYKNIEAVLGYVDEYNKDTKKKKKLVYEKESFFYEESRKLFEKPNCLDPETVELKWKDPDFDGLRKFLIEEKGFDPKRVESAINRIQSSKGLVGQQRLENFFGCKTTTKSVISAKKDEKKGGKDIKKPLTSNKNKK